MGMSDFDFSLLEVMNKNFLVNVTLKNGLLHGFYSILWFHRIFELKALPLRFGLNYKTNRKQAIHWNSMLIVKLVLDVHNIFQSKWSFSFQKYVYNLFYRQQLIFRHRH